MSLEHQGVKKVIANYFQRSGRAFPLWDKVESDRNHGMAKNGGGDNAEAIYVLGFKTTGNGVVHSLINCGSNPIPVFAGHDDFGNFESSEVRESQLDKLASLVQLVNSLECLCKWHRPILNHR